MNDSCLSSLFTLQKLSVLFDLPAYCSKKTQTKLNLNLIKHGFFIFSIEIFCLFCFFDKASEVRTPVADNLPKVRIHCNLR